MLVLRRNAEIGEDERDDEHVVHRERQLDEIAGEEFQRFLSGHVMACSAKAKSIARQNQKARPDEALP